MEFAHAYLSVLQPSATGTATRSPSSRPGSAARTRPGTVLPRLRGEYHSYYRSTHYDSWEEEIWQANADGRLLSSRLRDGRHAPVLDVDRPVTATASRDGALTTLTVPGLRARQARTVLTRLATDRIPVGLIVGTSVRRDDQRNGRDRDRVRPWTKVSLSLTFAATVHVHPSTTAGHHHVLVNAPMSWHQTVALAEALAGPVVDQGWVRACVDGGKFVIARPRTYDACC